MQSATLLMLGRRRSSHAVDDGPITAGRDYFTDAAGRPWTYQGVSMFLLFSRWLQGENIGPVCDWCASLGANVVRVLGMVGWSEYAFGPTQTPNWWAGFLPFLDYLASRRLRVEFTVFADAQIMMPGQDQQRAHLRRVVDAVGSRWNVFIEVANEPWQNGCDPPAIFSPADRRGVPMAYGTYDFAVRQDADGLWRATLPVLDYVTVHN